MNYVNPRRRPFSLLDLDISYPLTPDSISTATLVLTALLAPAIIILLIVLILVPGARTRRSLSRSQIIRRKLWELEKGLAGLALAVAVALFITQGLKNLFGKPRPHLLAVCRPDLAGIAAHAVGGYGQDISPRWVLVDSSICQETDRALLNDGFRSFPSGHASFSWSGLLYLSLFLCSKFAITIPYLPQLALVGDARSSHAISDTELPPSHSSDEPSNATGRKPLFQPSPKQHHAEKISIYNQAAAPPNYGLLLAVIPVGVAAYITSTRYAEFYHFGFDLLSGSAIGVLSAWFSFRWYHLPIRRGHGWAWGPRSRDRAFGIGVGVGSYVGDEGWNTAKSEQNHVQASEV